MSEEQLKAAKAAETEKVEAQVEEAVEEISEEDLEGVTGGAIGPGIGGEGPTITFGTCCGHDPCLGPEAGCNSEATAD